MFQSPISVKSDAGSNKKQENILDYNTIAECRRVVMTHVHVKKCLETIYNRLFKYGLEVMIGSKQAKLKKITRDHMNKYYTTFCKEFIICYYELGIVPVSITRLPNGHDIPIVMKDLGFITVSIDYSQNKGKEFSFYKLYSKRDPQRALPLPKLDKKTVIFSGYGHDPEINGSIYSPVSSCLPWILFNDRMFACASRAEERNTQPEIITELTSPDLLRVDRAMGTDIDVHLWYGDRDRSQADGTYDKIELNRQQFNVMEHTNRMYIENWNKMVGGNGFKMRGRGQPSKPMPMPVSPLPAGYRIASNIPHAGARSDLLNISAREEEIICSIFGVPKTLFSGEVRTTGGVVASSEMLEETLMAWRTRLSDVLTPLFKCIYKEEVCELFEGEMREQITRKKILDSDPKDTKALTDEIKTIMRHVMSENEVSIQFPIIPYKSVDEMWNQFLRNVISFSDFTVYSKMAQGLPVNEADRNAKAPWAEANKTLMMEASNTGMDAMVYQARFKGGLEQNPEGVQEESKGTEKEEKEAEPESPSKKKIEKRKKEKEEKLKGSKAEQKEEGEKEKESEQKKKKKKQKKIPT